MTTRQNECIPSSLYHRYIPFADCEWRKSSSPAFTKLYDQMMAYNPICNMNQDSDLQENKLPNGTHPSPTYASA